MTEEEHPPPATAGRPPRAPGQRSYGPIDEPPPPAAPEQPDEE